MPKVKRAKVKKEKYDLLIVIFVLPNIAVSLFSPHHHHHHHPGTVRHSCPQREATRLAIKPRVTAWMIDFQVPNEARRVLRTAILRRNMC